MLARSFTLSAVLTIAMVLDLLKTMSLKTGSVLMPFAAIARLTYMANYHHLMKLFVLLRVIKSLFY